MSEFVGFISDKLEIKLLILYIADRLVEAAPFEVLQELSMCDQGVDYFAFSDCLADLVRTEHLTLKDDKYLITRKGNRIVTDRTAVYPSFEGAHLISETPDTDYNNPDGTCHLDVIVDSNLIEVYVNDGEYVISSAVYGLTREIRCSGCKESRVYAAER